MKTLCTIISVLMMGVSLAQEPVWELVETVDEFGDKTGDAVVVALIKGTFDNSATTNSDLTVKIVRQAGNKNAKRKKSEIQKNPDNIFFYLQFFEYSNAPAVDFDAYANSYDDAILKIKLSDGTVKQIKQSAINDSLIDWDLILYNLILSQDNPFKVVAEINGSVYRFEVDPTGFAEQVAKADLAKK